MQNRSEVKEQKGMNGDVSTWKARGRRDYIQRGAKDMLVREREQVRTLLIQLIESVLSANLISAFVLPFLYDKKWGRGGTEHESQHAPAPDVMAIVMARGKQPERIRITKVTWHKLIQMSTTAILCFRMADVESVFRCVYHQSNNWFPRRTPWSTVGRCACSRCACWTAPSSL